MTTYQSREFLFECSYCNKAIAKSKYKNHVVEAHGLPLSDIKQPEFSICPYCDKRSDKTSNTKCHIKLAHEKVYDCPCDFCSKAFLRPTELRKHTKAKHADKQPNMKCNFCDLYFIQSVLKMAHESRHKDWRKFKCDFCHECFYKIDELENHTDDYHPDEPFKVGCNMCTEQFVQNDGLRNHLRKVHLVMSFESLGKFKNLL